MTTEAVRDVENDSVAEEKADLRITYKIDDVPPWYMCLFLGLQHFLTMIGGTLSIPFILCPALCMRSSSVSAEDQDFIFFPLQR